MNDAKIERQIELENEAMGLGITRYRKTRLPWDDENKRSAAGEESASMPGSYLVNRFLPVVAEGIDEWLDGVLGRKGKAKKGAYKNATLAHWLEEFDTDIIALAVLKTAVNVMPKQTPLTQAASNIVTLLEYQSDHERLKAHNSRYYKAMWENVRKSSSFAYKRDVVSHVTAKMGAERKRLDNVTRVKLGRLLLEILVRTTGLLQMHYEKVQGKTRNYLQASPTAMEWLENQHEHCERLFPVRLPMIVPPRDWTSPTDGGYISSQMDGLKMVKTWQPNYLDELGNRDMPHVYKSLNAIQRTPWRINHAVHRVMTNIWQRGQTTGKLPARDDEPLPARPADIDTNEDSRKDWKRRAAQVHVKNAKLISKRAGMAQKIWIADKFAEEDEIYFPHVLDWRGRVYPVPSLLNPQADDTGKALLEFAEGVELGEEGAWWLAVHIANVWGEDKVSFDERVQWVLDNEEAILDSALNPEDGQMFWAEADKPFQALAGAFEWLGYRTQGEDYVSHLPVALDGSCSGLQHFSAMLRDETGGAAVNLVPGDSPEDIYSRVAAVVSAEVEKKAAEGVPEAVVWLGKIDRSLVKQPTMTQPYGVSGFGIRGQIESQLKKAQSEGEPLIETSDEVPMYKACNWLAPIVEKSIGRVVVAAPEVMGWLKKVAKVAAKDGLPIRWETPAGFPVLHAYRKTKSTEIDAKFGKARVKSFVASELPEIDERRQAQGISPNYVHSMDASHLMLTVCECVDAGIQDFAMIHDSFGTHAANAGAMGALLRDAFVRQYSEEALDQFFDDVRSQLSPELREDLPCMPGKGSLDIEQVHESEYFFA